MEIILIVLGCGFIVACVLAIKLNRKSSDQLIFIDQLNKTIRDLELQNTTLDEKLRNADNIILINQQHNKNSIDNLHKELEAERARMKEMFEVEREQQAQKYNSMFENLSNQILERKSVSLRQQSQESITAMLKPFAEGIEKFRERIEAESKHRFALEKEVEKLTQLNMKMSQEANNLTSALKGNSKTQGDWGEMILETLLESSGLKQGIHFTVQTVIQNTEGRILRPDIILNLPEGKQVVIDSKVSLRSYVAMTEAEAPEIRKSMLAAHVSAINEHINELGGKKYHELVASPDFVVMFVPNEPAFLMALEGDSSIWGRAYAKGVILSSPTNLFAILRIVDELWKRDSQNKNALEIARQGGELYDKFVGFVDTFLTIGSSLEKSSQSYIKALSQLSQGKGNLARRAERLRDLGLKTSKSLPQNIVEDATSQDDEITLID